MFLESQTAGLKDLDDGPVSQHRYYYVTVPQGGQGQYTQDGQMQGSQPMQQANFVDASQMQNFAMTGQQYGFVQAQDGNLIVQWYPSPFFLVMGSRIK